MVVEVWFAFALASTALLVIPGPTVMLVVGHALNRGRATGWASVPGVALGDFTAMTLSLLGAGAILATSATLFTLLKLFGAGYLIWLGIQLWRAEPKLQTAEPEAGSSGRGRIFWSAYLVTALNPKSIVFFIAFVPQFVDAAYPVVPQFVILEATFLVLATVSIAIWVWLASELRARFRRPATLRLVNRIGGGFLIAAGLLTALTRRSA